MHGFAWTATAWGLLFGLWPLWLTALVLDAYDNVPVRLAALHARVIRLFGDPEPPLRLARSLSTSGETQ